MKSPLKQAKEDMKLVHKTYKGDGVFKGAFWFWIILLLAFIFGEPMTEEETREHNRSATASYSVTEESGTIELYSIESGTTAQ